MESVHITIEAPEECWTEIKSIVAEHRGEVSDPIPLVNPTQAPNFPITPDQLQHIKHIADAILPDMAHALSIAASLKTLFGGKARVKDGKTGKDLEQGDGPGSKPADDGSAGEKPKAADRNTKLGDGPEPSGKQA